MLLTKLHCVKQNHNKSNKCVNVKSKYAALQNYGKQSKHSDLMIFKLLDPYKGEIKGAEHQL